MASWLPHPALFWAGLLEGTVLAAVLALTALGLSLVFGIMRVVNVAHGEFFMLGAVLAWFCADLTASMLDGPPWAGFLVALLVAPAVVGAIAAAIDWLVLRRLNHDPEATIVATIGFLYILQQAALSLYGPDARPVEAPFDWRIQLPWFGYSAYKFMVVGAAVVLMAGIWLLLTRTRIGLVMRATQSDRETALAFGIPVDRVYAGVFALGAALAALGAVLIVPIQQAHYLMGGDPLLLSFIVVIIGGLGSLKGTLIAALFIGLADGLVSTLFDPTLAKILATLLVAAVLVLRPQGLFGDRTRMSLTARDLLLHLGVLAGLLALGFVLPAYHHGSLARILVLATFATGYNIAFGYTGLLSLGHAMFFAAGLYGAALSVETLGWGAGTGFATGTLAGAALAVVIGIPALRTTGVAFLIVTLMFAQAVFLLILYFGPVTRGDEGFVIPEGLRVVAGLSLSNPDTRYLVALGLFAVALLGQLALVRSGPGRVMVAMRENEERARMLGYDPFRARLAALVLSGLYAGAAGAAYALLFGYAGATFASPQYSVLPLLWVLLGGAGTTLGPLLGTILMFYLIDLSSSWFMPWIAARIGEILGGDFAGLASAYMVIPGIVLVLLVLFAPAGILGAVRKHALRWLP